MLHFWFWERTTFTAFSREDIFDMGSVPFHYEIEEKTRQYRGLSTVPGISSG